MRNLDIELNDGYEDHGLVEDFKDYDWKQATDHTIVNFGKTLDLPERGIPRPECYFMIEALKLAPVPSDREFTIVETGCFYGTSTRMFVGWTLKHGGSVHTCEVHVRDLFLDRMRRGGYFDKLHFLGNSLTAEWDKPIDFLFIDSGHSYNLAWGEYEKFSPFLVPGAVVGWHDTLTNEGGVRPAIIEANRQDTLELLISNEVHAGIEFHRFLKKGK